MSTTVLLVDSPPAVREALKARLSLEKGLEIVAEAGDATRALSYAQELRPEVMLLDGEAADIDVLALTTALAQHSPRIVVLTAHLVAMQYRLAGTPAVVIGKHEGIAALVNALRSHPSNV